MIGEQRHHYFLAATAVAKNVWWYLLVVVEKTTFELRLPLAVALVNWEKEVDLMVMASLSLAVAKGMVVSLRLAGDVEDQLWLGRFVVFPSKLLVAHLSSWKRSR